MRIAGFLGVSSAVAVHAGVLLFGGLLFGRSDSTSGSLQQVELLTAEDESPRKPEEEPKEPLEELDEEMEAESETVPDPSELLRELELTSLAPAPELEAASLGAIEQALDGTKGGSEFANALSFSSGGRIGGTGKAGVLDESAGGAFSLAEIDQKPRPIFQATPLYPPEMRGKRVEGVVTLIFVVDSTGKVVGPRVESSTHPAFEGPALDAVKKWKFEPGLRDGRSVPCKIRAPIRFQSS